MPNAQRGPRQSSGRSSPFSLLALAFSGSFRGQAWEDSGLPLSVGSFYKRLVPRYMQVQIGTLLRGVRVKDVMSTDSYTVDPELSLQDFVNEHLLKTGRRCFLVIQDGHLLGLITPNEVRTVEPRAWPFTAVRSVMRSADKVHVVSRDMPAMEALETMGREDVNQLPVMSDGRIEGIVSRAHVLQVLRSRAELKLPPSLPRAA